MGLQLQKAVKNPDGTITVNYVQQVQDINGITFTILAQAVTRPLADRQQELADLQSRIQSETAAALFLQQEIAACIALG